ncbi:MAG: FliA/WhiG family RNA polymerase sigma factor [Bacteroidota bacterium]
MANDLQYLAEQHAADPTPQHREAVVLAAVPLVRSLVGRLSVPDHLLAAREDLENVGLIGLLQALDSYNPERGTPFVSYAYGRVRGALVDYLRSIDALPRERRRRLAEAQQAVETLRQMLGAEPEDQDVADYLGISIKDYHSLLMDAQRRFALSLHSSTGMDSEQTVEDTLPHEDAMTAFEQIDQASLHNYLGRLIQELPEREQTILALYYYENLTLREIAGLLNLTEARISQILGKILSTLRGRLTQTRSSAA